MPSPDMLRVFKALSDRTRLRIVRLLLQGDLCVCELTFVLGMAQSRISHQLRILKDAGLADDTRDGQWIIYRIRPEARTLLTALLNPFSPSAGAEASLEAEDRKRFGLCRKEDIRKKKCPPRAARSGSTSPKITEGVRHGN
jgi:ArsR family transcriptional regulator